MDMLVDGEWRTDAYETADDDGSFDRQETTFRDWIRDDPDAQFQPDAGRYHLYVSYACPWAHRTLVTRALKGLEDAISVSVVDPYRDEDGWQFTPEKEGCTRDHVHDADYLRELYVEADPDVTCRVTVPVLWDKEEDTIVNNESKEVMRMLDTEFDGVLASGAERSSANHSSGRSPREDGASEGSSVERSESDGDAARDVDLYPDEYQDEVDRIIDEIYEPINNGVYRAGFATKQEPYDEAVDDLFAALDHWDDVLADQRYLAGDRLTEADIAMFTTLIRFDNVYHTHFMCNHQYIREYDNLWPYLRDLYQTPGVAKTVDMDHIKEHYYTTHPDVNPHRIIARGPDLDLEASHDRDELPGGPPADLVTAPADD